MPDSKYGVGDLVTINALHVPTREKWVIVSVTWERGGFTYTVTEDNKTGYFVREHEMRSF